jgi:hypothetical protein
MHLCHAERKRQPIVLAHSVVNPKIVSGARIEKFQLDVILFHHVYVLHA